MIDTIDGTREDILKAYVHYGESALDETFHYLFDERDNVADIIAEHNLDTLVRNRSDLGTALVLMSWLCSHYKHGNPPGGLCGNATPQAIMAAADRWHKRTNCLGLSLILAQMLRAYGIKACHVHCLPYEEPFDDCHVVVSAYCPSLGQSIMLDPSYNLYLKDHSGHIVSVQRFRDILIADGELRANPTDFRTLGTLEAYRAYMSKNLIRIQRSPVNGYGICPDSDKRITLLPEQYMKAHAHQFSEAAQKGFVTSQKYFWGDL